MWNQCAQRYLTHIHFGAPPINYRQLSRDYKASKYCEACQQRTTWILWYHPLEGTVLSCGSCREREDVRIAALAWKLSILKTDSNVKVLEMVMQWIKQRRSFPDLINEIQKARETYAPGTQEWKALDAACGVVQADHEACLIEDEEMGRR